MIKGQSLSYFPQQTSNYNIDPGRYLCKVFHVWSSISKGISHTFMWDHIPWTIAQQEAILKSLSGAAQINYIHLKTRSLSCNCVRPRAYTSYVLTYERFTLAGIYCMYVMLCGLDKRACPKCHFKVQWLDCINIYDLQLIMHIYWRQSFISKLILTHVTSEDDTVIKSQVALSARGSLIFVLGTM